MTIFIDQNNKEVIEATDTKGSQLIRNRHKSLGLVEVASSYNKIDSDFTKLGYNKTITATAYCKKYGVN